MDDVVLEMKDIIKEFSGTRVLDNVSFRLRRGTVHALMGENGAGKSTLMKILNGIYSKTAGSILINGKEADIRSSKAAKRLGIAMIHQELSDFPDLSVSANMFMANEYLSFGLIDERQMNKHCREMFGRLGVDLDPKSKIRDLSVAETQMVEIAKAISVNADIIIMDEPTSAITEAEVKKLFSVIRDLRGEGRAIIYISHKIDEIFQISDEITVLRDGQFAGTNLAANFTHEKLVSMMVGRPLDHQFYKTNHEIGAVLLEVKNLKREGKFRDVSFQVRRGEILGVAGLMGAGRTEVVETIFGLAKKSGGEVFMEGHRVNIRSPKDAIRHGLAFVSEDRKLVGLNLKGAIRDNITLANLRNYCLGRVVIQGRRECEVVDSYIGKLRIKTENRNKLVENLSGGNQQKVILARWMSCRPKVLILDEPTRGIDVGAKAEIHRLMDDFAAEGNCIIMVSSELPEILGMSDRIVVMHEGGITAVIGREHATQENIMAAASGF
ncbi:MAG: sugar ABC transporter ATP-binding protein [Synergistaceae bacterium]|nr:sugar ABC transporter ATP-binding protein [Synergistaceae bacterium]